MIKLEKILILICCAIALTESTQLLSSNLVFHRTTIDQTGLNQTESNRTDLIQTDQLNGTQLEQNESNETDEKMDAKDLFKSFLLKKLDLNAIPTNLSDTKIPQFLLDIFETNSLPTQDRIYLPRDSNTVRSQPIVEINRKNQSKRNKSGFIERFNLTLPSKETLNAGELRLYLNRTNKCSSQKQRITINQIIQSSSGKLHDNHYTTITEENGLGYRQIDTLVIKYDRHVTGPSWIQFDVLPAIESWLQNATLNYGLLIKSFCVDKKEFSLNEHKFVENFVISPSFDDKTGKFEDEIYDDFKPILLTYSNFPTTSDFSADNFDLFINKKKRHINSQMISSIRSNYENNDWKNGKTKDCGKYPMYISFKEIGWDSWIVSPTGFDAGLCYGLCSLSFLRNSNTTSNHATTQSLSNTINPNLVPPRCCVPTEFSPVTMIYREGSSSVIKIYENMKVANCGCR